MINALAVSESSVSRLIYWEKRFNAQLAAASSQPRRRRLQSLRLLELKNALKKVQ
jgi:hypothetical protein